MKTLNCCRLQTSRGKRKSAENEVILLDMYFTRQTAQLYSADYSTCSKVSMPRVPYIPMILYTVFSINQWYSSAVLVLWKSVNAFLQLMLCLPEPI